METKKSLALSLLESFTQAHGAPGNEDAVRDIFVEHLHASGEIVTDRTGGVACTLSSGSKSADAPRVLVAGHMDEVGFMVQNITPNGFLQFLPLGGWWEHTVLAQRVRIRRRDGSEIIGLTTSIPPHFLPADARNSLLPIDKMFIDIGATSRQDAESRLGITLGDTIVPLSPFAPLNGDDLYTAKAFDNRVGMAAAVQSALATGESELPCRPIAVGTTQEEVGTRGAVTMGNLLKPDVALVLEGPPADDTPGMNPAESQGRLGGGAQIRLYDPSAIMNRHLADFVIATAAENSIPHQVTVRRSGGTDARTLSLSGTGIPCVVLGVPARYIHSHNAVIDIRDYLALVELLAALLPRLTPERVASFTAFH